MFCDNKSIDISIGRALGIGVNTYDEYVEFTCELPEKGRILLNIFDESSIVIESVVMNDYKINSRLSSVRIKGIGKGYGYSYECDGCECADEFAKASIGARPYGEENKVKRMGIYDSDFDWENDSRLMTPFNEIISYQLHVRGFTKHASSKVKNKGTFLGIVEKIDYFKEMGINQLVLMPAYDFDEIEVPEIKTISDIGNSFKNKDNYSINYWGFTKGRYYMPKASYALKHPVDEFKTMVKKLHAAGIEVIMRIYFPDEVRRIRIFDILRYWTYEYHVDGFCIMGASIPVDTLCQDIYLADSKLYFCDVDINSFPKDLCNSNIAVINSDFSICSRKFLKSDEGMLNDFLLCQRNNPDRIHVINTITDFSGFTLNDLVSYDYKHNEDNNEENHDGTDYNYSWNCGIEGVTKKKSIVELRNKQMRNAFSFLLLAQATPMILAGDEFMNSQNGNNNPYCQDNETGWVNWKKTKHSVELQEFVKMLINLRKNHPVLHPKKQFKIMDYASCGFPDLSYHSFEAWAPKLDSYRRNIGLMLCGKYFKDEKGREDDFFYIAYNMHWDKHDFALPKLPKGLKWDLCASSSNNTELVKLQLDAGHVERITVLDRTVIILESIPI